MRQTLFHTAALIVTGSILTACGPDKAETSAATPQSKSAPSQLTTTPISFADALGETSVMIDVPPCPFASDAVIKASVRSSFDMIRKEVSNTQCRWSYNAGFAVKVTIEDLLAAKPISERRYNIGVDTTLEAQDGPGTNAQVLNDTAFDKPIPFAYSFEKDGKLVFMHYTGYKTNAEIMRPAANQIAARMSTAPAIEPQRRRATEPFKACEVWTDQDIRAALGLDVAVPIAPGASSMSSCSWKAYVDGAAHPKTVSFNIFKTTPGEKAEYEYDSYAPYSENGETHYLRESASDFGRYVHLITPRPEGAVWVTVSDTDSDPTAAAKTLQGNLLGRMVP